MQQQGLYMINKILFLFYHIQKLFLLEQLPQEYPSLYFYLTVEIIFQMSADVFSE